MKHSAKNEQALVNILLNYWEEIAGIEQEFKLFVGKGDMRPRIDYFHDAIRAFTSPQGPASRLSVEMLAYDVRCLHYIAGQPMASITHDAYNLSPGQALVVTEPGLVESGKRLGRDMKNRLKELYEQYGVLFSALLKATAENDYLERTDAMNHEVEEINRLIAAISSNAPSAEITSLIQHLTDEGLKRDLLLILPQIKGKSAGALNALIAKLRAKTQKNDTRIKGVDDAYHHYVTSQLAIYEASRDMLKKMASEGMNLVGQFVESALKQSQRGRGR